MARRLARLSRSAPAAAHDRPGAQPRQARARSHGRPSARAAGGAGDVGRLLGGPRRHRRRARSAGAERRADPRRIALRRGGESGPRPCRGRPGKRRRGDPTAGCRGWSTHSSGDSRHWMSRSGWTRRSSPSSPHARRSAAGWTLRTADSAIDGRPCDRRDLRVRGPRCARGASCRPSMPTGRSRACTSSRSSSTPPRSTPHPRGSGVLTVPGTHRAKALTHATAKWAWLAEAVQAGHRTATSCASRSAASPSPRRPTGSTSARPRRSRWRRPSALLGVSLDPSQVVASDIAKYEQSLPGAAIGQREAAAAVRTRLEAAPGIVAVGAWLSGTGLAQVVPDARAQAAIVRRAALFGSGSAGD